MTQPVRIPADVDREDRVLVNLTARQVAILVVTGIVLYAGWTITRTVLPTAVYLIAAVPIGATATLLALGKRDGLSLDRLLLAAIRQRLAPRRHVTAPEGVRPAPEWLTSLSNTTEHTDTPPAPLRLPAKGVNEAGVVDLGSDGVALVAVASTVNFALRTPGEQEALVAALGRYLHSLTAPVQILIRAERLDLTGQITELHHSAPGLPHPALEAAAREHADYLDQLRRSTNLLRRQVLLVLREPLRPHPEPLGPLTALRRPQAQPDEGARHSAENRLVRRLNEASELLSPTSITVTPLDAGQATAILATSCNPDSLIPPHTRLAGADEVITTAEHPSSNIPDQPTLRHDERNEWESD